MDIAAFGAALGASLRSAASAVGEAWMSIPSDFRAPTALLAAAGSLAALVLGYLKFWRENRGLEVSLRPGKYSGRIPPADRFEVYPFDLTITNRASSPNSLVNVRFFVDGSERRCTLVSPVGLLGRPIQPSESLAALVVVRAEWLMSDQFREIRFKVEPGRGRTHTFRIKAEHLISTY